MDYTALKEVFIDIVKYGFPTISIVISIISFIEARKSKKIQVRLNKLEEKLKSYELEEKEKERKEASKACVEARVMNISRGKYVLKFWNSGKATALNVNYEIQEDCIAMRQKVPYEFLESGKGFEEHLVVSMSTPSKFNVITTWENEVGEKFSKDQIVSI